MRSSGLIRKDVILSGDNNFIDFFNYKMLESSSSGIVSKDKKFVSKPRELNIDKLRKKFNDKHYTF